MNIYMNPNGKGNYICDCCKKKYKGNFYGWTSTVTHSYLGLICEKCAIKETFGNKYKQNRRYKEWLEQNQKKK